ncbi:MAG: MerR family transcriptional regulator [Pseudomonadota bacterium]
MARKKRNAFRTISEVSAWLDTPTHVLRFWESKFDGIEPVKRAGGRRYYRPEDLELIGGVKTLLHDEGKSIASVLELIEEKGEEAVKAKSPDLNFQTVRKPRKAKIKNDEVTEETSDVAAEKEVPASETTKTSALQLEDAVIAPEPEPVNEEPLRMEESLVQEHAERDAQENDVLQLTPEASARQKIDQSVSKKATAEVESPMQLQNFRVDTTKANSSLDEIEELYFDLQMVRNRIKRALRELR